MDEHKWTDEGLAFLAKPAGIYPGQPVSADPMTLMRRVAREILRLAERVGELEIRESQSWTGLQMRHLAEVEAENALLRRERALLIELEKARTRILASIFNTGGGCSAEDVRQVGELLIAVEAIHLEASGGVQRPEGVPCACVLCRPENRRMDQKAARAALMDPGGPTVEDCACCASTEPADDPGEFYRPWVTCGVCGHPALAHTGAPGNSRAIRDEDDHSSR